MKDNRSIEEKLLYSPDLETSQQMKLEEMLQNIEKAADDENYEQEINKRFEMIPVDMIDFREVNDYSISDIDALKKSIRKTGLQQNIVVKESNGRYVLTAGERRLTAYREIMKEERAKGSNRYDYIYAAIYPETLSAAKEDAIYKESNDTQRISTLFERIYRLNPKDHYFKDGDRLNAELVKEYFELKMEKSAKFQFDRRLDDIVSAEVAKSEKTYLKKPDYTTRLENVDNELITIKWDTSQTMNEYITMKLANRYKDVNISSDGVKKYTTSIMNCKYKPLITDLVLKDKIQPTTLREIIESVKSEEEQIAIYNKIVAGEAWDVKVKEEKVVEQKPEDVLKGLVSELKLFSKHMDNAHLENFKFTGDNKKMLTKIRNINAIIETLK